MQPGKTYLLHIQECLTEKYATRKINKNYSRDPSGFILHNLRREFIDDAISVISLLNFILSMSFCLCNKKNIPQRLEDMNFVFSCQKQYFFCNSKNNIHKFAPRCNIPCLVNAFHCPYILGIQFCHHLNNKTEASPYLYEEKLFV